MGRVVKKTQFEDTIVSLLDSMIKEYTTLNGVEDIRRQQNESEENAGYVTNENGERVLWCTHYTWTPAQYNEFKARFIQTLRDKHRMTKRDAEREWQWFNLNWGLRTVDENGQPAYPLE